MKKIYFVILSVCTCFRLSAGDDFCGIRNTAFSANETLTYQIFYSVIGIYINAGTASFSNRLERLGSKPVYHVIGLGTSNPTYDFIFKVRDKYETYFDTTYLQPLKFIRNVDEGGYKKIENVTFNQQANTATTLKGEYKLPNCVQDVLSSIYYARNIDFNRYKVNDKIPFTMFLDNEVYNLYIRYLGKEDVKTKYGKFHAIKFKPLLVKGTIFTGGENMNVWVSDDPNHVPLRVESPIAVGSIKVDLMGWRNLRYPVRSLINSR